MTFLYNMKHAGDQYRCTKFNEHFEVEGNSSYLCTLSECDCPAGVRPICRHREMLPKFIHRKAIGTEWMYDFDRGGWVQGPQEFEPEPEDVVIGPVTFTPMPPLPKGVQMFTLNDPLALHNAITEAVGEPEAMLPEPAPTEGWGEIEPEAIGQEVRINFAGTGYEQPLPAPTPIFNPTAGIPKTSFGSKDSPSYDNATWFSTVQPPDTTAPAKWRRF